MQGTDANVDIATDMVTHCVRMYLHGRPRQIHLSLCAQRMDVVLSGRATAFGCVGQIEVKTCAPLRVGGGPQTTSMRLDNRAADWESHAGTVSLRGEERAEDLLGLLQRQSDASIADRDHHLAILDSLRPYRKFTCGTYVLHGVEAIEHQVHEYLLQLDTVCHNPGNILCEVGAHRNRVPGGLVAQ